MGAVFLLTNFGFGWRGRKPTEMGDEPIRSVRAWHLEPIMGFSTMRASGRPLP